LFDPLVDRIDGLAVSLLFCHCLDASTACRWCARQAADTGLTPTAHGPISGNAPSFFV